MLETSAKSVSSSTLFSLLLVGALMTTVVATLVVGMEMTTVVMVVIARVSMKRAGNLLTILTSTSSCRLIFLANIVFFAWSSRRRRRKDRNGGFALIFLSSGEKPTRSLERGL